MSSYDTIYYVAFLKQFLSAAPLIFTPVPERCRKVMVLHLPVHGRGGVRRGHVQGTPPPNRTGVSPPHPAFPPKHDRGTPTPQTGPGDIPHPRQDQRVVLPHPLPQTRPQGTPTLPPCRTGRGVSPPLPGHDQGYPVPQQGWYHTSAPLPDRTSI